MFYNSDTDFFGSGTGTSTYRPAVILSVSLLLLSLAFVGCDNVLQEKPTSFIGPDNFYRNKADARRALAGAYSQIRQGAFGGYIGSYQWLRMVAKPLADLNGLGDHKNGPFDAWQWGPAATERNVFIATWNAAYEGINAANAVVNRVPGVDGMSEQLKAQYVAEAKFIRGIHYYYLTGFWGGVPIKRDETTSLGGLEKPNASEDSTYIFAINTLESAIPDLPADNQDGRATKTAGQALLAKLYLQRAALNAENGLPSERQIAKSGDYQRVVELTNAVINSGKYSLPMDVVDQFNDLFWEEQGSTNNPEIIFDYQQDLTKGPWAGGLPNLIGSDTPSTLAAWHSNSVGQAGIFFYDSMKEDDDLRAQVTFLEELPKASGDNVFYNREDYEADGYKEDVPVFRKYAKAEEEGGSQDNNDWIILRYADILLMKAEALNEINDGPTAEAYDLVNRIRERAGLDPVSGLSYEGFREEIYTQRRRELVLEGHGWHTLQRFFEIGTERVRECSAFDAQFPPSTTFCPQQDELEIEDPKDRLYPIPAAAFARNPQLKQNSGYK